MNDAPHSSSERWVDGCLCDGCGVLSKTKGTWQAAGLRLDQTGLVYWTSPSLLCAHQRLCVRLQSEVSQRSAHSSKTGTTQTTHRAASSTTKEDRGRRWHTHRAYALFMTSTVYICIDLKRKCPSPALHICFSFCSWRFIVSFFFFSLLLGLSHQPPALPSLCPYTHSENNVLAPALCFSMVLGLECVPVKGDIYLLSAERERRPSLLRDTDRRGKVEQQFPEALFNSLASGCRGTIGCFIQWRLPLVNLTTAWQQKAVGSMQESVVVVLREWVW